MTKPMSEPTPALEAANYGWRIRQLERRPDNSLSTAYIFGTKEDFQVAGFVPTYDSGTGVFFTNDPGTFSQNGAGEVSIAVEKSGTYVGSLQVNYFLSHGGGGGGPDSALNRAIIGEVLIDIGITGVGYDPVTLDEYWWSKDHHYLLNNNSYEGTIVRTGMWTVPPIGAPFVMSPITICKPYLVDTIVTPFASYFKVTRLGSNPF